MRNAVSLPTILGKRASRSIRNVWRSSAGSFLLRPFRGSRKHSSMIRRSRGRPSIFRTTCLKRTGQPAGSMPCSSGWNCGSTWTRWDSRPPSNGPSRPVPTAMPGVRIRSSIIFPRSWASARPRPAFARWRFVLNWVCLRRSRVASCIRVERSRCIVGRRTAAYAENEGARRLESTNARRNGRLPNRRDQVELPFSAGRISIDESRKTHRRRWRPFRASG